MAMIAQLDRIWQLLHFCSCILKKMIQGSSWIWQLGKMPQPSWAQPGELHRGARRDAESVNMHLHRTAKMILISAVCDNLQNIEYALAANRYSTMTFISFGRCHLCDKMRHIIEYEYALGIHFDSDPCIFLAILFGNVFQTFKYCAFEMIIIERNTLHPLCRPPTPTKKKF